MSTNLAAVRQALDVFPPTEGNVVSRTTTDAGEVFELPNTGLSAEGNMCYWTIQADGIAIYVLFGTDSSVTVDPTAVSDLSGTVVTPDPTSPALIPAGQERSFRVPSRYRFLYHTSSGNTGKLRLWQSSGPGE